MIRLLFFISIFWNASILSAQTPEELAESAEWKSLLHINDNNQTEISDPNFFISMQSDSKIELLSLLENKTCENICKYPARYRYLAKKLDFNVSFEHCDELQSYLKEVRGESASLVFASSFLGSPASYFGHTFVSIDKSHNVYFSKTLGYAAELPNTGNPLDIVVKGVSGQYNGRYVLSPYYQMLEMYNVVEQRTLYEYKLDLTAEEVENIIWHSYELQNINVPYKFFTENCAYEVFWLIEVARPSLNLRQKLKSYVIPYETIQVLKDANMVKEYKKRLPLVEHLYQVYDTLNIEEKELFSLWKESDQKEKDIEALNISESTKMKFAELINGYYDILFKKFHISKADYYDVRKLSFNKTILKKEIDFEPRKPHKISFGTIIENDEHGEFLNFRPVLMDRFEERDSLLSESTLEFLNVGITRRKHTVQLNNFDIIKVESLNKKFDFYEPSSWRVYLGGNRTFYDESFSPVLEFGTGLTQGNDTISTYGLLQMAIYPAQVSIDMQALLGMSMWIYKGHLTFDYKKSLIDTNGAAKAEKLLTFYYPLDKEVSLRLSNDYAINESKIYLDIKF